MNRKSVKNYHQNYQFDSTELLLLAFVAAALLIFVSWQANVIPPFLTQAVLGITTVR